MLIPQSEPLSAYRPIRYPANLRQNQKITCTFRTKKMATSVMFCAKKKITVVFTPHFTNRWKNRTKRVTAPRYFCAKNTKNRTKKMALRVMFCAILTILYNLFGFWTVFKNRTKFVRVWEMQKTAQKKPHKNYRTKNHRTKKMLFFDLKKFAQKKAHKKQRTKNRPCWGLVVSKIDQILTEILIHSTINL